MSTTRKRWISAEVDGRLVAQLQREAEARGISRSEAVRRALLAWTREAMEENEERIFKNQANHRQVMNRLDFVVGMLREQDRAMEQFAERGARADPGDELRTVPGQEQEGCEGSPETGALAEARKRARRRL